MGTRAYKRKRKHNAQPQKEEQYIYNLKDEFINIANKVNDSELTDRVNSLPDFNVLIGKGWGKNIIESNKEGE